MQIIDLTHFIEPDMTVYPGTESPVIENANTIRENGFAEKKLSMVSHTGTHIDAPSHILPGHKSLDDFPVDKFMGNAICIKAMHPLISKEYLIPYENEIRNADFFILHTGWDLKWKTQAYFQGFPVLSREAAEWLTRFRLKGIGLDCISIDPVSDEVLQNHHIILEKDILIIENLTGLEQLPDHHFIFQCFPLKIKDADGAPVRAIGLMEN
jgi:arylformamidase